MTETARRRIKIPLLIVALALAFILPKWEGILQAAICGIILGMQFPRHRGERTR